MEAPKVCIDTGVLIELLRGREPAIKLVKELEDDGASLSTTSVNVFELYYGVLKSKKAEQNLKAVKKLFERFMIFGFTEEAAKIASGVLAELEAKGRTIDLRDLFIGTTALANGYTILTENVEHFKRIKGLKLLAVL